MPRTQVVGDPKLSGWTGRQLNQQWYIHIAKNIKYISMIKPENRPIAPEPICKKIQNYIFKFSDMLGQGNFSKITNDTVAIKIIELNSLKSQKLQQLLFSEIDVLKKLNHPNILRCFEVFTSNRNCYIITEICNGGDLESKLRREHHFSEHSAQPIIKDIFQGLLYLAQKNVIHRDLKVANVFLHNGRAKIADFGFAKFTKTNFKDINIGSPIYMSPEGLIHNIYGPKTDIWAFGVLIYELLHGETPFAQCRTEVQLKYHLNIPISQKQIKQELSAQIKEIICSCMEIDQTKRVTAFQLEQMPYFRKLLEKSPLKRIESPLLEKKYSSSSQRSVAQGSHLLSQQILQRHNFLLPKDEHSTNPSLNNRGQQNERIKNMVATQTHKANNSTHNNHQPKGGYSVQKRAPLGFGRQKVQSQKSPIHHNQIAPVTPISNSTPIKNSTPTNNSTATNNSKIFSATVTFKECVNLLHYCRLVYKYVSYLKCTYPGEDNQIRILSTWVLLLMDEIKKKINQNGILYDGENAWLREKKLREVTNQYTKKYQQELTELSNNELNLTSITGFTQAFYSKVDMEIGNNEDSSWLFLGHYMIMIVESTNLLRKCFEECNYRGLNDLKELEQFLCKNRDTMDFNSYKIRRAKILFLKDKHRM